MRSNNANTLLRHTISIHAFLTVVYLSLFVFTIPSWASNHFAAYQVKIDKVDGYKIRFTDGSDATYIADHPLDTYYLDNAILFRDGSDWGMCYQGDRYELDTLYPPTQPHYRIELPINYVQLDSLSDCY